MNYFLIVALLSACAVTQIIIENIPTRIFVKPLELVTIDVFDDKEYLLYLEDLAVNTKYKVTLSYSGSLFVQYDMFLEEDTPSLHSSVHKRRIQDTRIFSFETNKFGEIIRIDVSESGVESVTRYDPILHIVPKHHMEPSDSVKGADRFATLVIEPVIVGTVPIPHQEFLILGIILVALLIIPLLYENPTVRHFIKQIMNNPSDKSD